MKALLHFRRRVEQVEYERTIEDDSNDVTEVARCSCRHPRWNQWEAHSRLRRSAWPEGQLAPYGTEQTQPADSSTLQTIQPGEACRALLQTSQSNSSAP